MPRWGSRAPTTATSARPSATQSTTARLSPIRSVIAMSGNFSLKRPISGGSTYSPGVVLAAPGGGRCAVGLEHARGRGEEEAARGRGLRPAAEAVEQPHAQFLLERADVLG